MREYVSSRNFSITKRPHLSLSTSSHGKESIMDSGENVESSRSLSDYVIGSIIGEGKYSLVYRAQRRDTGKLCVLKRVHRRFLDTSHKRGRRLIQEAKLLQKLRHVNIIGYTGYLYENHDLFLELEWAGSGDLRKLIQQMTESGSLIPEDEVLVYILQVSNAVNHLHTCKILHRDLKPENIFLFPNKLVKVGDFGLSKQLTESCELAHSAPGTPLYMAPETIKNLGYDYAADVWSLGCIFYELCWLHFPFGGKSNATDNLTGAGISAILQNIAQAIYPELIPDVISKETRAIIAAILKENPLERPHIVQVFDAIHELVEFRNIQLPEPVYETLHCNLQQSQQTELSLTHTSMKTDKVNAIVPRLGGLSQNQDVQVNVLIVDDDKLSALILSKQLERLKIRSKYVFSGEEALRELEADSFDLMILDVHMPGLNGLEVLDILTGNKSKNKNTSMPIVMISGDANASTPVKLAGAKEFFAKPVKLSALKNLESQIKEWKAVDYEKLEFDTDADLFFRVRLHMKATTWKEGFNFGVVLESVYVVEISCEAGNLLGFRNGEETIKTESLESIIAADELPYIKEVLEGMIIRGKKINELTRLACLRKDGIKVVFEGVWRTIGDPMSGNLLFEAKNYTKTDGSLSSSYRLGKLLHKGTNYNIYTALDFEEGYVFIVKEGTKQMSEQERRHEENMISFYKGFNHRNLIKYYGYDTTQDGLFHVLMEYCNLGSVSDMLQQFGPFSEFLIKVFTFDILMGLDYLHGKKMFHGNLSCKTILVADNDESRCGLCKLQDYGGSTTDLRSSDGIRAQQERDIWVLGCVVIGMYTGNVDMMSDTIPSFPQSLSKKGTDFLRCCFQSSGMQRWTAKELLRHPWLHISTEAA